MQAAERRLAAFRWFRWVVCLIFRKERVREDGFQMARQSVFRAARQPAQRLRGREESFLCRNKK